MGEDMDNQEEFRGEAEQPGQLAVQRPINMMSLQSVDLEGQLKNAEKFFELQSRIRQLSLNVTNQGDWVDEGNKPYLQWTGTSKIAMAFGVSYKDLIFEKELVKDDKGEYLIYHCMGVVSWQNREVPELGTGSTRDSFFGVRTREKEGGQNGEREKYFLPMSEVDITSVKKKALTNMLNRGLKDLLGLSFSWDEIEKNTNGKITKAGSASVSYKDKGGGGGKKVEMSEEGKKLLKQVGDDILSMFKGDAGLARGYLERATSWKVKDGPDAGKEIKGKTELNQISEKQLKFLADKVKQDKERMEAI
jgi:hypothetical protein